MAQFIADGGVEPAADGPLKQERPASARRRRPLFIAGEIGFGGNHPERRPVRPLDELPP